MTDEPSRQSKKTEMIEVRVSHETKRDFLAACRRAGRTASDVVRESIEDFIRDQERPQPGPRKSLVALIPRPVRRKRYLAAGAAVVGLTVLAALPSAAAPDFAAVFKSLDANGDGVLSSDEFSKTNPPETKRLSLRMAQRGAAAPKDPEAAVVFFLPPETDPTVGASRRTASLQQFSADGKLPPTVEERRRIDFANFDRDGNGSISLAEYQARQNVVLGNGFKALDKDGNGALEAAEYNALGMLLVMAPPEVSSPLPVEVMYGPVISEKALAESFVKLDANKDGKLSLQEYPPSA